MTRRHWRWWRRPPRRWALLDAGPSSAHVPQSLLTRVHPVGQPHHVPCRLNVAISQLDRGFYAVCAPPQAAARLPLSRPVSRLVVHLRRPRHLAARTAAHRRPEFVHPEHVDPPAAPRHPRQRARKDRDCRTFEAMGHPSSAYRAHLEIEATLTFKTDAVRRMLPK